MIFDSDYYNETMMCESNTEKKDKFNNPIKSEAFPVKVRYIKSSDGLDVKTNTVVINRVYHSDTKIPPNSTLGGYRVIGCYPLEDALGNVVSWRVVVV